MNKLCEHCSMEISNSDALSDEVVIFCSPLCFTWQEIQDD